MKQGVASTRKELEKAHKQHLKINSRGGRFFWRKTSVHRGTGSQNQEKNLKVRAMKKDSQSRQYFSFRLKQEEKKTGNRSI